LRDAVVSIGDYAVGLGAAVKNELRLAITARLAEHAFRVRMHGSAAIDLAWLADGRIDAAIIMANTPWDMTAGVAIAREAGAVVLDRDGTSYTSQSEATIAVAPALVNEVLAVLAA
jgi:myo-inositol-1(or 4)-monophosphatase